MEPSNQKVRVQLKVGFLFDIESLKIKSRLCLYSDVLWWKLFWQKTGSFCTLYIKRLPDSKDKDIVIFAAKFSNSFLESGCACQVTCIIKSNKSLKLAQGKFTVE